MEPILNIAGVLLYLFFRVVVFPVILVVECIFGIWSVLKAISRFGKWMRAIRLRPALPFARMIRLRFNLSK